VGNGPINYGTITLQGGITVNFSTLGSSTAVYNFSGTITNSGTALNFGPGTYNIKGGLNLAGGGATTSFGAGTFNIGPYTGTCSGAPAVATNYSICFNGTSLTFGGPSTFVLSGGIWVKGGETVTMGSGSTNSYNIGAATNGNSLDMGGGAKMFFADATGVGDLFQMAGNLNDQGGGGSCLTIGAATQHD